MEIGTTRWSHLMGKVPPMKHTNPWIFHYTHGYSAYPWGGLDLLPIAAIILSAASPTSPLAAAHIINQIVTLASSLMACPLTSLSFSLFGPIGAVSCPTPTLGPSSHWWDVRTFSGVLIPAIMIDWDLFSGPLLDSTVMKSECGLGHGTWDPIIDSLERAIHEKAQAISGYLPRKWG